MEKEEEGRVELKLLDVKLTFADLPVVTGACRALGSALHSRHLPSPPREALGLVLHKDSKWYQQWKDFKNNNVVFNRECGQPTGSWAGQWQQILARQSPTYRRRDDTR